MGYLDPLKNGFSSPEMGPAGAHTHPFLSIGPSRGPHPPIFIKWAAGCFAAGCGGALRARRPPGRRAFWNFRLKIVPDHLFLAKNKQN